MAGPITNLIANFQNLSLNLNGGTADQNFGTVDLDAIRATNGTNANLSLSFSGVDVEVETGSRLNMSYHMAPNDEIETKHAAEAIVGDLVTGKFTIHKGAEFSIDSDTGFDIDFNYAGHDYHLTTTSHHIDQDQLEGLITLSGNLMGTTNLTAADFRYLDTIPKNLIHDFVLSNLKDSEEHDAFYAAQRAAQHTNAQKWTLGGGFFENNAIVHSVADSTLASIASLLPHVASFLSSDDTGIRAEDPYFSLEPMISLEAIEAEINDTTAALAGAEDYLPCSFCGF